MLAWPLCRERTIMTDRDARGHESTGADGASTEADEGLEPATCALPGCDEPLSELPGGLKRQYCSPAHRAAARQLSVQHAWRSGQDEEDAEAVTARWEDDDWEDEVGWRVRRLKGRRLVAALAAVALVGGAVSAVLLTRGTPRPATRPAGAASQHARVQTGPDQLLAKGSSWAGRAEHTLAAVTKQLSVLTNGEKSITDLPSARRSRRADALLPQIRRQISKLRRERASLSRGLTSWGLYQRSALELAGVSGELNYLRKLTPQQSQVSQSHGTTAGGGSITSATRSLAADQKTLTSQVGTLTADVRKTVAHPVAAVPAGNLVKQVLNVIPTVPASTQAGAPALSSSPVSRPIVTRPATPSPSPSPSPSKARSSSVTAPPQPRPAASRLAGDGQAKGQTAQKHQVAPQPVVSILPRPVAGLAGHNAILRAAEAAANQAIQNESRTLGPGESRRVASLVRQILQWIRSEYYRG